MQYVWGGERERGTLCVAVESDGRHDSQSCHGRAWLPGNQAQRCCPHIAHPELHLFILSKQQLSNTSVHLNSWCRQIPGPPSTSLCPLGPPRWSSSHMSAAQSHILDPPCLSPNDSPVLRNPQPFHLPSISLTSRISPLRESPLA